MSYAVNAQLPVILAERAITTRSTTACGSPPRRPPGRGRWRRKCRRRFTPSRPVRRFTTRRSRSVYQSTDDEVEVGYTPGYLGAYEEDGTVVYGTGWDYEPWYGDDYYGWGWTWGYSYVYVPWYQWWVWRAVVGPPGGLRSAVIENIYDRWQGRNGVTPLRSAGHAAARPSGDRRIYRLPGAVRTISRRHASRRALSTAEHLALNPYSRPPTAVRPGEIPRGAQLLTTVRQAPGGGRDLYASPDGSVYRRKNDGWYRRQAGGQMELRSRRRKARSNAANWRPRAGRSRRRGQRLSAHGRSPMLRPGESQARGSRVPGHRRSRRARRRSPPSNASIMRARWRQYAGAELAPGQPPSPARARRRSTEMMQSGAMP